MPPRPEPAPPADRQQRRQQREPRRQRHGDPDRGDGSERVRAADLREQQHEHRQRDGQPAGEDRGPAAPEGGLHRVVLVGVAAQLLAVARDQQQAVVRAHPEHQDDEDARAVVRHRRARARVEIDEALGDPVGEADHHQRDQRDHRRAVDQAEQDEHERDRDEQDLDVDRGEDLLEVRVEPERAGHRDLQAAAARRARDLAQRLAPFRQAPVVVGQLDHRVGDGPVGADEARRRAWSERNGGGRRQGERAGRAAGVPDDAAAVRRGQPAGALVDDEAADRVAAAEALLLEPQHLGGLRVGGEEALRAVVRDVRELRAQRSERDQQDDPAQDHEPLAAPAGRDPCERAHRRMIVGRRAACKRAGRRPARPRIGCARGRPRRPDRVPRPPGGRGGL